VPWHRRTRWGWEWVWDAVWCGGLLHCEPFVTGFRGTATNCNSLEVFIVK
jgi:hypothetical protein